MSSNPKLHIFLLPVVWCWSGGLNVIVVEQKGTKCIAEALQYTLFSCWHMLCEVKQLNRRTIIFLLANNKQITVKRYFLFQMQSERKHAFFTQKSTEHLWALFHLIGALLQTVVIYYS